MSYLNEVISLVIAEASSRGVMLETHATDNQQWRLKTPNHINKGKSQVIIKTWETIRIIYSVPFVRSLDIPRKNVGNSTWSPLPQVKNGSTNLHTEASETILVNLQDEKTTDLSESNAEIQWLKPMFKDLEKSTGKGLSAHSDMFSHPHGLHVSSTSFEK